MSDMGSHLRSKQLRMLAWQKKRLLRNVSFSSQWSINIPNGDVCHFSRFHCAIATQIRAGMTSGNGSIRSTMFDLMKERPMMSFRPVFINETCDADMKHAGARALLLQPFPPALSREQGLFPDECAVYYFSTNGKAFGPQKVLISRLNWTTTKLTRLYGQTHYVRAASWRREYFGGTGG